MEVDVVYNEDCLIGMDRIPSSSIDMILCDLPYGTTCNKWDVAIPFDILWKQYKRIIKENGAIVLFGDGMFTAKAMLSNKKMWRYNLIYKKNQGSDFLNANWKPLKAHEDIMVFYKKRPTYNKQHWYSTPYEKNSYTSSKNWNPIESRKTKSVNGERCPLTVLEFKRDTAKLHPTQKPVALLEWLIKTYTNEGDVVLDNAFGSGSTLVAARNTNRHYLGFETDKEYFNIALKRLNHGKEEDDGTI